MITQKQFEINPDYADAYCNRGAARGDKGDAAGQIKRLYRTIELIQAMR